MLVLVLVLLGISYFFSHSSSCSSSPKGSQTMLIESTSRAPAKISETSVSKEDRWVAAGLEEHPSLSMGWRSESPLLIGTSDGGFRISWKARNSCRRGTGSSWRVDELRQNDAGDETVQKVGAGEGTPLELIFFSCFCGVAGALTPPPTPPPSEKSASLFAGLGALSDRPGPSTILASSSKRERRYVDDNGDRGTCVAPTEAGDEPLSKKSRRG